MANIHVQYDKSRDEWVVKKDGAIRASARTKTQLEAITIATRIAKSDGGEVVIHRKDNNRIRDKNTIGKKDPFPPRG